MTSLYIVNPQRAHYIGQVIKQKQQFRILFVFALIACLIFTAAACSPGMAFQTMPVELLQPVEAPADLVAVRRGDIKPVKVAEAIVVPYSQGLSFRAADAPIAAIYVTHGQKVAEGDLLAELDTTTWLNRLKDAREEMEHINRVSEYEDFTANVRIELAQIDLQEAPAGLDRTIAELALQELLNNESSRRSSRELDKSRVQAYIDLLETQNDDYAIYAPFDGVILSIEPLTIGDYPSGRVPFIYVADLNRLTMRCLTEQTSFFSVAESIIAVIGEDEWVAEIIPYTLEEQLAFYYEGISPPARFAFSGIEGGHFDEHAPPTDKRVLLMANEIGKEDVIIIPLNAAHIETASNDEGVASRQDFAYVDINGVRERRDIRCGRRSDIWIEVIEGLSEGELVYVD